MYHSVWNDSSDRACCLVQKTAPQHEAVEMSNNSPHGQVDLLPEQALERVEVEGKTLDGLLLAMWFGAWVLLRVEHMEKNATQHPGLVLKSQVTQHTSVQKNADDKKIANALAVKAASLAEGLNHIASIEDGMEASQAVTVASTKLVRPCPKVVKKGVKGRGTEVSSVSQDTGDCDSGEDVKNHCDLVEVDAINSGMTRKTKRASGNSNQRLHEAIEKVRKGESAADSTRGDGSEIEMISATKAAMTGNIWVTDWLNIVDH
ncbi:hypothetical protein BDN67DRAFT_986273, partial [Paxillus ammoniavirescens]